MGRMLTNGLPTVLQSLISGNFRANPSSLSVFQLVFPGTYTAIRLLPDTVAPAWVTWSLIWGIILEAAIAVAQVFGVTPEAVPDSVEKIIQLIALAWSIYGRITADTVIKK